MQVVDDRRSGDPTGQRLHRARAVVHVNDLPIAPRQLPPELPGAHWLARSVHPLEVQNIQARRTQFAGRLAVAAQETSVHGVTTGVDVPRDLQNEARDTRAVRSGGAENVEDFS